MLEFGKVNYEMISGAYWHWEVFHAKSLARKIVHLRRMLELHVEISHLFEAQQDGHISLLQDLYFGGTYRSRRKVNYQLLIDRTRFRVRETELSETWLELEC